MTIRSMIPVLTCAAIAASIAAAQPASAAATYTFVGSGYLADYSFTLSSASQFTSDTYITGQTCMQSGVSFSNCGILFSPAGTPSQFKIPNGPTITGLGQSDIIEVLGPTFLYGLSVDPGVININGDYASAYGGTLSVSGAPSVVNYTYIGSGDRAGEGFSYNAASQFTSDTYITGQTCMQSGVSFSNCGILFSPAGTPSQFQIPNGPTITGLGQSDIIEVLGPTFLYGLSVDPGVLNINGDYASAYGGTLLVHGAEIAAVPEPTTWALMIMGFGLIGATERRKKAVANFGWFRAETNTDTAS